MFSSYLSLSLTAIYEAATMQLHKIVKLELRKLQFIALKFCEWLHILFICNFSVLFLCFCSSKLPGQKFIKVHKLQNTIMFWKLPTHATHEWKCADEPERFQQLNRFSRSPCSKNPYGALRDMKFQSQKFSIVNRKWVKIAKGSRNKSGSNVEEDA
jgi:hypothetical protein